MKAYICCTQPNATTFISLIPYLASLLDLKTLVKKQTITSSENKINTDTAAIGAAIVTIPISC